MRHLRGKKQKTKTTVFRNAKDGRAPLIMQKWCKKLTCCSFLSCTFDRSHHNARNTTNKALWKLKAIKIDKPKKLSWGGWGGANDVIISERLLATEPVILIIKLMRSVTKWALTKMKPFSHELLKQYTNTSDELQFDI